MAWVELNIKFRGGGRHLVLVNLDKYESIYIDPDFGLNVWAVKDGDREDLTGRFDSLDECREQMNRIRTVLLSGTVDQDWDGTTGLEWLKKVDEDDEEEDVF